MGHLKIIIVDESGIEKTLDRLTVITRIEDNEIVEEIAMTDADRENFIVGKIFDFDDIIACEL